MSARNVGYGLRMAGAVARPRTDGSRELLDLVGLPGFGDRRSTSCPVVRRSGSRWPARWRRDPRLLALTSRWPHWTGRCGSGCSPDLRAVLGETGHAAVFVTHDQAEAFAIADRVAVMVPAGSGRPGRGARCGLEPADEWVAGFVGYPAVVDGTLALSADETLVATTVLGDVPVDRADHSLGSGIGPGAPVRVALRPAALVVDPDGELTARCVGAVPGPDRTLLTVRLTPSVPRGAADHSPGDPLPAVAPGDPEQNVADGSCVRLRFDPSATAVIGVR